MGASKRIMEMFVNRKSKTNRCFNGKILQMLLLVMVAYFMDLIKEFKKNQPIVAPNDIKRFL